jgi:phosphatidate cytidylyltransferase
MDGPGPFDIETGGGGEPSARPPSRSPRQPTAPRSRRRREAPPARRERRERRAPSSETLARIAWAIPWIAFAITVIVVGGGLFAVAAVVLAWIGLGELSRMAPESRPLLPVAMVVSAAMVAAAYWGAHLQIVLAFASAFPLMLLAALLRGAREAIVPAMAVTVFGLAWIGIPFAHAVLLRELPDHGAGLLVNVLVATFLSDTGAYAGGRLLGRHPLAPAISPKKTVEGLVAGFVAGTLGFWFAGLYQDWLSGTDALLMGMCVAAIAPLGDLFASLVKRSLGAKDSGTVFGPHGGLLDRLDAVLFTVVVGYYLSLAFVY